MQISENRLPMALRHRLDVLLISRLGSSLGLDLLFRLRCRGLSRQPHCQRLALEGCLDLGGNCRHWMPLVSLQTAQ